MIPVKGHIGLYRDEYSGAIVNCSTEEFDNYIILKKAKLEEKNEIELLKNEIKELQKLVYQLVNNK